MPRYTCMESMLTISIGRPGRRRATSMASADLPDAVVPTSARCRGAKRSAGGDGDAHLVTGPGGDLDELSHEVVGRGAGDAHLGVRPGRDRAAEMHETVVPGPARRLVGVAFAGALNQDFLGRP